MNPFFVLLPMLLLSGGKRPAAAASDVVGKPSARSPLPGIIPAQVPVEPDPRRAFACRLANNLFLAEPGKEDRSLVSVFQTNEGLKPSGYYGPGTALVLAERYAIVPPPVRYWTRTDTGRVKDAYRARLRAIAARDRVRAEEWLAAAAAVGG